MSFGGSHWCRPMSMDAHRSTDQDEDRSMDYSRHRSTSYAESTTEYFSSSMHHVLWIRSSGYEVVDTEVMVSREEEVVVNIAEVENVRVGDIKVEAMVKVVDIGVEVVVVMDTEMVDTEVMDTKVDTVVVEVVTREKEVVVDTKKVEEVRVKYIEVEPWWKKKE
ncbi:hypothetical protein F2Q69_00059414 [Brassica cretica]|uniref:Uncharacterized protein n=1 Tax=Brassica cretica TaxID=69181 RepID=A0A8S9RM75_BRACR|nr:hypothetical protein F2Q69_00059414 [Brassica cretica]